MAKHLTGEHKKGFFNAIGGNFLRGGMLGAAIVGIAVVATGGLALPLAIGAMAAGGLGLGGVNAAWGGARWTGETVLNGIKGLFGFGKNAGQEAYNAADQGHRVGFAEGLVTLIGAAMGIQSLREKAADIFGGRSDRGGNEFAPAEPQAAPQLSARQERQVAAQQDAAIEQQRLNGLSLDMGKDGITIPAAVLADPNATRDFLQATQRDTRQAFKNDQRRAMNGDLDAQARVDTFLGEKGALAVNPAAAAPSIAADGSVTVSAAVLDNKDLFQRGGTGLGDQLVGYADARQSEVQLGDKGVQSARGDYLKAEAAFDRGKIGAEELQTSATSLREAVGLRDLAVMGPQGRADAQLYQESVNARDALGKAGLDQDGVNDFMSEIERDAGGRAGAVTKTVQDLLSPEAKTAARGAATVISGNGGTASAPAPKGAAPEPRAAATPSTGSGGKSASQAVS